MIRRMQRSMILKLYSEVEEYRKDLPSRKKEASECISDVRQQLLLWQRTLCFVITKDRKVRTFRFVLRFLLQLFGFAPQISDSLLVAVLLGKEEVNLFADRFALQKCEHEVPPEVPSHEHLAPPIICHPPTGRRESPTEQPAAHPRGRKIYSIAK